MHYYFGVYVFYSLRCNPVHLYVVQGALKKDVYIPNKHWEKKLVVPQDVKEFQPVFISLLDVLSELQRS